MALIVEKKTGILDKLTSFRDTQMAKPKKEKIKVSFISNYFNELKEVSWPTKKQVLVWFFSILLITTLFTLAIVGVDTLFKASFEFVNCTSPKSKSLSLAQCASELPKNISSGTF
ncbi:MAG: preprotein translocase subunit SecE [Patescibacteria group bacterium]